MKPTSRLFVLLCASHIGWVQAEIYKSIDSEGRVTYSSAPTKGAKKLDLEPPLSPPSTHARVRSNASPSDFPKVDSEIQKSRDNTRRRILADELAAEEKLLAEALQNLRKSEDGKASPDAAKHNEEMKPLKEQVSLHEKNVDALKTELSNLK